MDVTLTINGGSSSIKFGVFEAGEPQAPILFGELQRVGQPGTTLSAKGLGNDVNNQPIDAGDHTAAADHLIGWLRKRLGSQTITGIGHRVVHGGLHLVDHTIIDAKVLEQLRAATVLDSAHLPREIKLIEAFARQFPGIRQVACLDTAFHKDLPPVAKLLPIPRKYSDQGIHRFWLSRNQLRLSDENTEKGGR